MSRTEEALARSVLSIDGARRVGWARAFSAEEKLDDLSADLNRAMGDRENFKSGLSFLWGFTVEFLRTTEPLLYEDVKKRVLKWERVLDPKLIGQGRAWAVRHRKRVTHEKKRREHHELAGLKNVWQHRARVNMAARFGFESLQQMEDLLARYQEAKCRPPLPGAEVLRATALQDGLVLTEAEVRGWEWPEEKQSNA